MNGNVANFPNVGTDVPQSVLYRYLRANNIYPACSIPFPGMGLLVSRLETNSFTPRNKVFHTEKPTVSCRETKSFKGRNKKCPTTGAKVSNTETGRTKCGNALIKRINSGMFLELSDDICL